MRKEEFILPDGEVTKSVDDFIQAWQNFTAPIAAVTDMELYGWDVNQFTLIKRDVSRASLTLPCWFIAILNKYLPSPEEASKIVVEREEKEKADKDDSCIICNPPRFSEKSEIDWHTLHICDKHRTEMGWVEFD